MRWLERLDSLSYRIKMPASFAAAALISAFVIAMGLTYAAYDDSERAIAQRAERIGDTAAKALPGLLLKDELWAAYELLSGFAASANPGENDVLIVVTGSAGTVYVSTAPAAFPIGSPFHSAPDQTGFESRPTWASVPVLSNDGDRLGVVHVGIARPALWSEFASRMRSVMLWTLVALAIILPLGWYAGNRMAKPLVQLAEVLPRVGSDPAARQMLPEHPAQDEIGIVTRRFNELVRELAEQDALRDKVSRAEHLAAIGRLAGEVAHEINNPLAGLLNAIDTQRRHGSESDALNARTLDLLERGLNQIHRTVGALLVEVRAQGDMLSAADFEDLMTLIEPGRASRGLRVEWDVNVGTDVALPAAPIRQVALNLLLNAIEAAHPQGRIALRARTEGGQFTMCVSDDGDGIPDDVRSHLFEPFHASAKGGQGLGLWVTHQTVQELNGSIAVTRSQGETLFEVRIPLANQETRDATRLPH